MRRRRRRRASPSDLLLEILARVPYRSLCRFKCVSWAWLALYSDPAVRKRSPQSLSGFFGLTYSVDTCFLNLSGRGRLLVDPSLRFVPGYRSVRLLGCCGGILLCRGRNLSMGAEYIVCNPATEEIWAVLPVPDSQEHGASGDCTFCLCFDPAEPCCFVVFVFIGFNNIKMVEVYASDTGEWTSMSSRWGHRIKVFCAASEYVFWNDTLHFIAFDFGEGRFDSEGNIIHSIVTVDKGGNTWRTIQMPPRGNFSFIGQSQGCLYGMQIDYVNDCPISVWVLEDYTSGRWTLKHTVSVLELVGRPYHDLGDLYNLVAIDTERNLIFLNGRVKSEEALMSYDMDTQKLHVICTLEDYQMESFKPYIPCFVESPMSDAH